MELIVVFLIASAILLLFSVLLHVKNDVTYKNHVIIANAIHEYNRYILNIGEWVSCEDFISYDEMEHYNRTLFRLYDWGYTHILPQDRYKLVEPFIETKGES